jgi:hypothetical protein
VGLIEILAQIDGEISQLKQARALLQSDSTSPRSSNTPKKRNLTPEGRRRIAEAVKRRWALQKKNHTVEAAGGWVNDNSSVNNLAYPTYQTSPM